MNRDALIDEIMTMKRNLGKSHNHFSICGNVFHGTENRKYFISALLAQTSFEYLLNTKHLCCTLPYLRL